MSSFFSEPLRNRSRDLLAASEKYGHLPEMQGLAIHMQSAIDMAEAADHERPAAIALFGGTHVGKSALFNALMNRPGASSVSEGRGCTTQVPIAAVHPQAEAKVGWLDEVHAERIPGSLPEVVLIDTADIDGVEGERQRWTRRVMDLSDVLVYVTSPDKRANFDVLKEVKSRVNRKRWFFVMTRADQVEQGVFEDFCRGIKEMGFETGPHSCFFVDGTSPDAHDLPRLRSQIFSTRPAMQLRALHEEVFLGEVAHALRGDNLDGLRGRSRALIEAEVDINRQVGAVFDEVLSGRDARKRLRFLTEYATWREAVGRVWSPLKLAVWIRARSASLPMFFTMGRMATGGPSIIKMLTAGVQSLSARNKYAVPMELLGRCFAPAHLERLDHLKNQARREVEDLDLDELLAEEAEEEDEKAAEALRKIPVFGKSLEQLAVQSRARRVNSKAQVLDSLGLAIDEAADELADRAIGAHHNFFGNLLPCLLLVQAAWRLLGGWITNSFLNFNFFWNFLLLFLAVLVPGLLLVGAAIRRVTRSGAELDLMKQITEPAETEDLRHLREGLDHFVASAERLEKRAAQSRETINKELSPEMFGTRAV